MSTRTFDSLSMANILNKLISISLSFCGLLVFPSSYFSKYCLWECTYQNRRLLFETSLWCFPEKKSKPILITLVLCIYISVKKLRYLKNWIKAHNYIFHKTNPLRLQYGPQLKPRVNVFLYPESQTLIYIISNTSSTGQVPFLITMLLSLANASQLSALLLASIMWLLQTSFESMDGQHIKNLQEAFHTGCVLMCIGATCMVFESAQVMRRYCTHFQVYFVSPWFSSTLLIFWIQKIVFWSRKINFSKTQKNQNFPKELVHSFFFKK